MKLQQMTVVFVIVFLPIILVTSYFISLQVDTIDKQQEYDTKLLDATYDAMSAFELNTANEDLASVADSLRSIIDASNNIFFNTLATNLGVSNASKAYVQPYVPAILYTLYDGFYIYSPTSQPEVCTDKFGQTISTDSFGVSFNRTINYAGKPIGIYTFNKDSITYDPSSRTTATAGDTVNYSILETNNIEHEYGQLLYKNTDGTYSTVLHTTTPATTYKQSYILKSFMPYTATYDNGRPDDAADKINITVNYTLDNFLTIQGYIGNSYYSKSGYLIDNDLLPANSIKVQRLNSDGTPNGSEITVNNWYQYAQDNIDAMIDDPANYEVKVILSDGTIISNQDAKLRESGAGTIHDGAVFSYWDDAKSAIKYYVDSYIFSKWVYENLSGLTTSNIQNNEYTIFDIDELMASENINADQTKLFQNMFKNFSSENNVHPFAGSDAAAGVRNDPEDGESVFAEHKRAVIKNSVTYNLVLSMIAYTQKTKITEFNMPVFSDKEWDKILTNVSIVTFMQGMPCGLSYYNNYVIVTGTNNEITVTPNEIYYVPRVAQGRDTNGDGVLNGSDEYRLAAIDIDVSTDFVLETAHRIDCEQLKDSYDTVNSYEDYLSSEIFGPNLNYISFKAKEVKYDKVYSKADQRYIYDHKVFTDYHCIVDSNYLVNTSIGTADEDTYDGNTYILDYLLENGSTGATYYSQRDNRNKNVHRTDAGSTRLRAYRIAVAKERNNLYKSIAFAENYGYQVFNNEVPITGNGTYALSNLRVPDNQKISKVEITYEDASCKNGGTPLLGVYTDQMKVSLGTNEYDPQAISVVSTSRNTITFKKDFGNSGSTTLNISFGRPQTHIKINSVKVYFK